MPGPHRGELDPTHGIVSFARAPAVQAKRIVVCVHRTEWESSLRLTPLRSKRVLSLLRGTVAGTCPPRCSFQSEHERVSLEGVRPSPEPIQEPQDRAEPFCCSRQATTEIPARAGLGSWADSEARTVDWTRAALPMRQPFFDRDLLVTLRLFGTVVLHNRSFPSRGL